MHFFYGCHGVGSSTAVNQLAAVKDVCYDRGLVSPARMLEAVRADFNGFDDVRTLLKSSSHKLCCGDVFADELLRRVFDSFASALDSLNLNGHRIRPGTGSA